MKRPRSALDNSGQAGAAASGTAAQTAETKRRRLAKLKAYKERKKRQNTDPSSSASASAFAASAPAKSAASSSGGGMFGSFKKKKKKSRWGQKQSTNSALLGSSGMFGGQKKKSPGLSFVNFDEKDTQESSSNATQAEAVEVDPLDAFMNDIAASGKVVAQVRGLTGVGGPHTVPAAKEPVEEVKTISLEDILAGKVDDGLSASVTAAAGHSNNSSNNANNEADEDTHHKEFMETLRRQRKEAEEASQEATQSNANATIKGKKKGNKGRDILDDDDADTDMLQRSAFNQEQTQLDILREKMAKKQLKQVDHSKVDYAPFRKSFYIQSPEIGRLPLQAVQQIRSKLGIKIRGKNCPRPIEHWHQAGLSDRLLANLNAHGYDKPFAIQRQTIPAIMKGRDVIGVAKTGSGKTLAFLIPMMRHILDQPPLAEGEGPIGLIMAPSRELAVQIYKNCRAFTKPLGRRCVCVYGGSSVKEQIGQLKAGADVVVCTPGRMIDILCMNAGKLITFKRVTYVVLDEADRMFDMGFEPQITSIIRNTRPDRQTVMFSATFPRIVESLARSVLTRPVEIVVGGRSVTAKEIDQHVEIREADEKFPRLLQLLGIWYEKGNVIVFVDTQQRCDALFQELLRAGYPGLSLHGGKDQVDRDYTIRDFKSKVRTLLVATSVAGRGLDVKDLKLVVNYNCPNHLEDYVHRVGRTGRAGQKGTAYTFIERAEDKFAPDLVKALVDSKKKVPDDLQAMADAFKGKLAAGTARKHVSGFIGKGYKFDESEQTPEQQLAAQQRKAYEIAEGLRDVEDVRAEEEAKKKLAEERDRERQTQRTERSNVAHARNAPSNPAEKDPAVGAARAQFNELKKKLEALQTEREAESKKGNQSHVQNLDISLAIATAETKAAENKLNAALKEFYRKNPKAKTATSSISGEGSGKTAPTKSSTQTTSLNMEDTFSKVATSGGGTTSAPPSVPPGAASAVAAARMRAEAVAKLLNAKIAQGQVGSSGGKTVADGVPSGTTDVGGGVLCTVDPNGKKHFHMELEINDYPQNARWKVCQTQTIKQVSDQTEVALTTQGQYFPPGRKPGPGEQKLSLLIEGNQENFVRNARDELIRLLEEATVAAMTSARGVREQYGRYNVI